MMPDREKVIKALEFCTDQRIVDTCYGECPYAVADDEYKCMQMKLDALSLLKEQEAMLVEYSAFGGMKYGGCPRCNARVDNLVNPKACGFCGQAVKWE